MPGYIDFVKAGCHVKPFVEPGTGMWGASTDAKCQAYQTNNGKTSIVQFKVYGKDAIYFVYVPNAGVRINMLTCKGSTPSCSVDGEGGGPLKGMCKGGLGNARLSDMTWYNGTRSCRAHLSCQINRIMNSPS